MNLYLRKEDLNLHEDDVVFAKDVEFRNNGQRQARNQTQILNYIFRKKKSVVQCKTKINSQTKRNRKLINKKTAF